MGLISRVHSVAYPVDIVAREILHSPSFFSLTPHSSPSLLILPPHSSFFPFTSLFLIGLLAWLSLVRSWVSSSFAPLSLVYHAYLSLYIYMAVSQS
jgi:pilus assembly protein TadC